jgi:CubicO group peptidase (beta-lactamase class C family)
MAAALEAQLDALAARVLEAGTAPALAVAVTDRERTVATRTYGTAGPGALWPIASIGKAFAAVVALQLADEGVLDLHAPVTDHLPWLAVGRAAGPVTVHHLLAHTSGLIETSDLAPASAYDVIALAGTDPGFAPGEHRHYSNVGYRAVGVVLEALTGQAYGDLVQSRVLDRLGMHDSVPVMRHDVRRRLPAGHAPLYDDRPWRPEHGLVPAPWVESAEADGCACCTPEDLAVFARALWQGSDRIVSRSGHAAMTTAHPPHDEHPHGYGLEIHPHGFGHGGDMLGYVAHMRVDTAAGLGVVAFASGPDGARLLGEGALAIAAGEPAPDPPPYEPPVPLVDDGTCPAKWTAYPGRYRSHNPWLPTFLVAASGGTLVMGEDLALRQPPRAARAGRPGRVPGRRGGVAAGAAALRHRRGRGAQRAISSGMPYYRAFTS